MISPVIPKAGHKPRRVAGRCHERILVWCLTLLPLFIRCAMNKDARMRASHICPAWRTRVRWQLALFLAISFIRPVSCPAPLVWKPGEGWVYENGKTGKDAWIKTRAADQTNSIMPKTRITTFSLGKLPVTADEGRPLVSPDCRHVAYRVLRAGKCRVSLDGVEGEPYEKVSKPFFSPDGKHLAYLATKGFERQTVVVDGKEGRECEFVATNSLTFSPDSLRVAFASVPPRSTNVWVVLGGTEGAQFHSICEAVGDQPLLFSPDGKRLAYGATRITDGGNLAYFVVVDGDQPKIYPTKGVPGVAGFSPDSRQVAWLEEIGAKKRVVVDGKAGKEYDAVGACFRFSPDGSHTAYPVEQAGRWKVVLDDREGPAFDAVTDRLVFSADSRQLAFAAKRGDKQFVVQDGREGSQYDRVGTPVFSPDGQHLAYFAQRGSRHFVVRDGHESPPCDNLGMAPVFSPDGMHLAYAAQQGDNWRFILDGKPGREYDKPLRGWLCFSPDSKHLAYGADRRKKIVVVLDEQELCEYEGAGMGTLIFDGPGLLRCVIHHMDEQFNWELLRLEISLAQE